MCLTSAIVHDEYEHKDCEKSKVKMNESSVYVSKVIKLVEDRLTMRGATMDGTINRLIQ